MIAFWGSADRGLLIKSLQHRLASWEITQEEYQKKLNTLSENQQE